MSTSTATTSFIINPEITLLIAEHVGCKTLSALLRLNRPTYCLFMTYQHSIVKSRIRQQLIPDPAMQPPLGSLLSSHGPDRQMLEPYSFEVLGELELRQRRINALFNTEEGEEARAQMPLRIAPPLVEAMSQIPCFVALDGAKQGTLVEMFKEALWAVDRIADQAVCVKLPEMGREVPTDPYAVEREIHRARRGVLTRMGEMGGRLEISLVSLLVCLCGMAYLREHPQLNSDPGYLERITAFEETVLRQGSFAVWGFLHPCDFGAGGLGIMKGQQQSESGSGSGRRRMRSPSQPPRARSELAGVVARRVDEVLKEMEVYETGLNESTVSLGDDNDEEGESGGGGEGGVFVVLDGLLQTLNGMASRLAVEGGDGDDEKEGEDLGLHPGLRVILRALRG